jgi:hypothetical protein
MITVAVAATNVLDCPGVGGHFWVYAQYAHALRRLGCRVTWLERARRPLDTRISDLRRRLIALEIADELVVLERGAVGADTPDVDLLLNFDYTMDDQLLARFRRTALVDIDPGLLQFWIAHDQIRIAPHDFYFTTGETVGTAAARFSDCGRRWITIRPPVCLDLWPYAPESPNEYFTTISSWWGDEWITDGETVYENNKRVTFLAFANLPHLIAQPLEVAAFLGPGDTNDRRTLERSGWRVRHALDVAETPEAYRTYVQESRGEFSCVKPSCIHLQNAWISDRTLCYLASGRPAVVQHTGPSSFLPNGDGLFRVKTLAEAAQALHAINANYERHRQSARAIAEDLFDAQNILQTILDHAV